MQVEILKNLPAILMHSELQKPEETAAESFLCPTLPFSLLEVESQAKSRSRNKVLLED